LGPAPPIPRRDDENVAVALDGGTGGGIVQTVAVIGPRRIQRIGDGVDGQLRKAVDPEILPRERVAAGIGVEGKIEIVGDFPVGEGASTVARLRDDYGIVIGRQIASQRLADRRLKGDEQIPVSIDLRVGSAAKRLSLEQKTAPFPPATK
jgi:hypothetical protein